MDILAVAVVASGQIDASRTQAKGAGAITYDPRTGVLDFPNPQNKKFVPVVGNLDQAPYITSTHWAQDIGPHHVVVYETALDTGGRTWPGHNFSTMIIEI